MLAFEHISIPAAFEVLPQRLLRRAPKEYSTIATFPVNEDGSSSKIDLLKTRVDQFAQSASGCVEQLENCPVAWV
jgi:hypothetical protein